MHYKEKEWLKQVLELLLFAAGLPQRACCDELVSFDESDPRSE